MCETVQSNVLLLFLGEKKDYNYNAHSKIGRSICWWRDEKKHAGEKVKKCLKSKQKQIEAPKDWACFSFRSYFRVSTTKSKDTKQEVSVKIMAFQNAKTL